MQSYNFRTISFSELSFSVNQKAFVDRLAMLQALVPFTLMLQAPLPLTLPRI